MIKTNIIENSLLYVGNSKGMSAMQIHELCSAGEQMLDDIIQVIANNYTGTLKVFVFLENGSVRFYHVLNGDYRRYVVNFAKVAESLLR